MRAKKQRKIIKWLIIASIVIFFGLLIDFVIYRYSHNRSAVFKVDGDDFQISRGSGWQDFIIKGTDTDAGNTGIFSGETRLSRREYSRLFTDFAASGINVIRVYTVLSPEFYKAFFEYNLLTDKPLFLLQGIRLRGRNGETYGHAYDDRLNSDFLEEIRRTIDVIHGKAITRHPLGSDPESYTLNIAPYLMGYILCLETDKDFMKTTNTINPNVSGFEGDFLYTVNANPFEAWMAAISNYTVSYEREKYGKAPKLLSWTNLIYRDALTGINFEHICPTEKFGAGILFAWQEEWLKGT